MAMSYAVGVVNFGAYVDLRRCLDSIKRQSTSPSLVWVVDADPEPVELEALQSAFPAVRWDPCPNRGFGAGANRILEGVRCADPEIGFILILNPDTELDPSFAEVLVRSMGTHPRAALASGKLLRRDGLTIDSAGILMGRSRRPRDRGSERLDGGQYDRLEQVFGVSGAAMMLRCDAIAELAVDGEVFDEDFFVYHEDTDLAWRANLLGWSVLYVPEARALHSRRWRRAERMRIACAVRRHSFKNHYLQIIKNEPLRDLLWNLPILFLWEFLRLGFVILRDPGMLPAYLSAVRLIPRAWAKRRRIQERVRAPEKAGARSSSSYIRGK